MEQLPDKTYAERFLHAAAVMERVREQNIDLVHWGVADLCGTFACIAGHCATEPWFQRRGFRAQWVSYKWVLNRYRLYPSGGSANSWSGMIEQFFGPLADPVLVCEAVDVDDTEPRAIAANIRSWVKETYGFEPKDFPSLKRYDAIDHYEWVMK